ncbi:uncharacterized protein [Leptinotarsa decemlineata]|uniref:uncharacterized protein n=1 Tax=Leptinotarsa decemlineata TaxID=7539 RepID=UPI003D30C4C7
MAPSTDGFVISIKTEIETFYENVTLKSEEKYDALDVGVSENEFQPEQIKSEDDIDIVYHDVKSENNIQELNGESYCGLCGGRFINTMDYFGVEDLKVICYCENNDSNAIHGEDVSQDLNPSLHSTSDEMFDVNVYFVNGNMPSALNGKEFSNGNEHGMIHTPEQVNNETQNEGTDLQSLRNRNTGKTPVQYESCTKNSTEKRNLRSREKDHDGEMNVNGKICTRSSVIRSGVTNYLETRTEVNNQLQCNVCSESFLQGSVLKRHEKSHTWEHLVSQDHNLKYYKLIHAREKPVQCKVYCTGKSLFQCKICSKTFHGNYNLKRHEKTHIGEKLFQRTISSESFIQNAEVKLFQCKFCSKTFTRNYRLKDHELTHTRVRQFHCKVCLKTFTRLCSLERHETTHTEDKLFQCKYSSKSFNKMENLKRHKKFHSEEKPFHCKFCSQSFTQNGSLIQHEKTHRSERPFLCKMCSKTFDTNYHLKRHEKTHIGEKLFQCQVCSKSFIRMASLIAHGKDHISKGPFQCKICAKTFQNKDTLKRHEKNHSGEKPFQCKICPRAFFRSDLLTNHEKTHNVKKLIQCKFCSETFERNTSLKAHESTHSGIRPYQCEICPKAFIRKYHLIRHHKIHN